MAVASIMTPSLRHDSSSDVLYVRDPRAQIATSAPIPGDGFVVLNFDASGHVVGLQLLEVGELTQRDWREFFRTGEIPPVMFDAVDAWLAQVHADAE